jgi:acetylornithine/succinyldiaminopimelate/putrescine aminotransferase
MSGTTRAGSISTSAAASRSTASATRIPAIRETLARQADVLIHSSNLYYNEWQGRLAQRIVGLTGPGKVFFCNSGAEANEGADQAGAQIRPR